MYLSFCSECLLLNGFLFISKSMYIFINLMYFEVNIFFNYTEYFIFYSFGELFDDCIEIVYF